MRDQNPVADLEDERLLQRAEQSIMEIITEAGTLEEVANAHRLNPHHTDLSRAANGTDRVGPVKRFLALLGSIHDVGGSRELYARVIEELRWYGAAKWEGEVPDPSEVLQLAEMQDAEEDRTYSIFTTSERTPERWGRLADAYAEQAATSHRASVVCRQQATQERLA